MAETRHRRAPERFGEPLETLSAALRAAGEERIRALVRRLAALGLSERAVKGCFAVSCVAHARRRPPPAIDSWPPASVLPRLFVTRQPVPLPVALQRLHSLLDDLEAFGLIACDEQQVSATVMLLPVGEALAVCGPDPDDSTFHLIGALPDRKVTSWVDVGTGNAIVPLARRGLAPRVLACDIDGEAIAYAHAGITLSGAVEVEARRADLLDTAATRSPWPLITFNAPIPTPEDASLLDRFWQQARDAADGRGEVIVHSQQPARDYPACLELPGCTVAVRYTPPSAKPAFGVTIWRPSERERRELIHVQLSPKHPHISRAQFHLDA